MRPNEAPIGVTGATGGVGSRVVSRLAERGVRQRLVVRDVSRASEHAGADVVWASSYGDSAGMRRALAGVGTLFLVSAKEAPDRVQQHKTAVDAAVAARVERIVYLSYLGAASDATFTYARQHFETEEHVRATGLPYTFLRSSAYLDIVSYLAGPDGVIRGPAGDGRVAPVSRDDIAEVVEAVLMGERHDGQTYELTGPKALTLAEIAHQLSRAAGRPISYEQETLDEARASRRSTGAPDWEIEGWVTSYAAIAAGEMGVVSDAIPKLTGHEAQTLDSFLRTHPESYRHLLCPAAPEAPRWRSRWVQKIETPA
jgi:NAD(P)H dehydrogenase (quinone)